MKRPRLCPVTIVAAAALLASSIAPAADPMVTEPDGTTRSWSGWLRDHGPAAVVLWASWAPGADGARAGLPELAAAAARQGLEPVLVAVQEPLDEAARGLEGVEMTWFHDRYGQLLKDYRVVRVPALLVVTADGRVAARLDVDPAALQAWKRE